MERWLTGIAIALLLLGSLAGCGEEKSSSLAASIAVEYEGEALQFGEVPVRTSRQAKLVIRSLQQVPLQVHAIDFVTGDGAPESAFTAEPAPPLVVGGTGSREVRISFEPLEVRRYQATAVIRSNDPRQPEVRVPLVGDGVAGRLEVIACLPNTAENSRRCPETQVVPPEALDMGNVTAGSHATALITLRNGGGDSLQVARIFVVDGSSPGFSVPAEASAGMLLHPNESTNFSVSLDPPAEAEGAASARIAIEWRPASADEGALERIEAELRATIVPNTAPRACLYVREIRHADGSVDTFGPGEGGVREAEPTDVIVFDAAAEEGCTGDREDGENLTLDFALTAPAAERLEPIAGEPMARSVQAEAIGLYRVELTATDAQGLTATASAEVNVVLRRDIAVEIAWFGDPLVDVDVHFVRAATENLQIAKALLWSANDKYWNSGRLDWGSVPGASHDDPQLLVDDLGEGALVETVVLDEPEEGMTYWIFARFNRDERIRSAAPECLAGGSCPSGLECSLGSATAGRCMEPVEVDVRVFLKGEEIAIPATLRENRLVSPCDTWVAGRILWNSNQPSFVLVDDLFADDLPAGNVCSVQ